MKDVREPQASEISNCVRFDVVQYKTDEEKTQARSNLGASSSGDMTSVKGDITKLFNLIAPSYSSKSTYEAGDIVLYSKKLYVCKADIETAEAWTAAHWEEVTLSELIVSE